MSQHRTRSTAAAPEPTTSLFSHLECGVCARRYPGDQPAGLCECGRPLLSRYALTPGALSHWPALLEGRSPDLWRYAELLPPVTERYTLGEGGSPHLPAPDAWTTHFGVKRLTFKWEGMLPTFSFKARGMAVAISRAVHFGAARLVVPTAGNAGVAAAAYAREAGVRLDVFMPADTDPSLFDAASDLGAIVHKVPGFISDCGREAARLRADGAWDLSTLKEPYRLEGKKTMGLELWEHGALPNVIVYPTGGGTGLVGMWKAFRELQEAGCLPSALPRMVSVQMAGCAPICRAFEEGATSARPWEQPDTDVLGLRVPQAVGDILILQSLRESGGLAVTVTEEEAFEATDRLNGALGIDASPECGAALAGLSRLRERRQLREDDDVVVFLTGAGVYYRRILERLGIKPGVPKSG